MSEEGTEVAGGKHVVPEGVAVEELNGGKKKLSKKCPPALLTLLDHKDLLEIYDAMVEAVVAESNTRGTFGKWHDKEFDSIVDIYREDFAMKGVRVALCKRKSADGTRRWLEFIDIDMLGDTYVPQYDVANYSGQAIRTVFTKLEFPKGVAVEELKQYGNARTRLKEKIPAHVQDMMTKKDLMTEYQALVDHCAEAGVGKKFKSWNITKLKEVISAHADVFEKKGVSIFVSHKQEYVSHGQSGHTEYFRWIEFVDREAQPNYHPQRDAETKGEDCVIS
uniref:Uncharacterized protein n=1 Tax=Craspedostauros australis TaxID=1486917 RepID=A0A7R9ZM75_9STRA